MRTPLLKHTGCVWDVSFCPYYEVLVSCDAGGRVLVSLPPLVKYMTRAKLEYSMHKDKVPNRVSDLHLGD